MSTTVTTNALDLTPGTYAPDAIHSTFGFSVRYMGLTKFKASFDDVDANLVVTDDGAATLTGVAKTESVSIRTPQQFVDHVVYGDDFLSAEDHPTITFAASSIDVTDDGAATVEGTLTVRGVAKPLTATGAYTPPTEDAMGTTKIAFDLTSTIDRRDWGLDWQAPLPKGGDALAWDVDLAVNLILVVPAEA